MCFITCFSNPYAFVKILAAFSDTLITLFKTWHNGDVSI